MYILEEIVFNLFINMYVLYLDTVKEIFCRYYPD